MASSSVEAAIQKEEALIRAYEAELAILRRNTQPTFEEDDQEEEDDDDDVLQDLQQPLAMRIGPGLESEMKECLELTQSIQGFVFDSVQDTTPESNATSGNLQYVLKGHFVDNPTICATIAMTTERPPLLNRKRKREPSSRVIGLTFRLESSCQENDETLKPIEDMALKHFHLLSLPDWIHRVSAYLRFEKQQKETLERWNNTFPDCQWDKDDSSLNIDLHPGGKGSALPTFSWGWDWREEEDKVEMKVEGSSGISPDGLQDLVSVAGSCKQALEMILKAIKQE